MLKNRSLQVKGRGLRNKDTHRKASQMPCFLSYLQTQYSEARLAFSKAYCHLEEQG